MTNTSTTMMKKNTEQKRRVGFSLGNDASNDDIESPKNPLILTDETCRELWYQPDDIAVFKHDTRNLLIYGRTHYGESDLSGLERYSMERSRHKKEVLRYILMIHRMGKDENMLGSAARSSTAWAADVASEQGYHDYCAAYRCPMESNKRKASPEPVAVVPCGRRVRQRTMSAGAQPLRAL